MVFAVCECLFGYSGCGRPKPGSKQVSPWLPETAPLIMRDRSVDSIAAIDLQPTRLIVRVSKMKWIVAGRTARERALIAYAGSAHNRGARPVLISTSSKPFLAESRSGIHAAAGVRRSASCVWHSTLAWD